MTRQIDDTPLTDLEELIDRAVWSAHVLKQPEKAARLLQRAIKIKDTPDLHVQLFHVNALQNKYPWEEFEYRLPILKQNVDGAKSMTRYFELPPEKLWKGQQGTVLVFAEQGLGDVIQFMRYLPYLKKSGCHVIMQDRAGLTQLFRRQHYIDEINDLTQTPHFDYFISLLSLPYVLQIPVPPPSLAAPAALNLGGGFKVGITWAGNKLGVLDDLRSMPLHYFNQLANVPGVKFFSLQKEPRLTDDAQVKLETVPLDTLEDTAAAINGLDVVFSVDTSVLHLAGTLGKPTYAIIPATPDWRWGLHGQTTPWYPSVHLVRQSRYGEWGDVIETIIGGLTA